MLFVLKVLAMLLGEIWLMWEGRSGLAVVEVGWCAILSLHFWLMSRHRSFLYESESKEYVKFCTNMF